VAKRLPESHLALVPDYNDGTGRFTRTDGFFDSRRDGAKRLRQEDGGGGGSAEHGGGSRE
jgi:hypothetical protein